PTLFRSAEDFHLVLELVVVLAVGSRQPGGKGGIEVTTGHALPHDGRLHRLELDLVAEFAFENFTGDMGDGDAVVPAVHITDLQGGFVGGQGAAHADGQGGG